jgi:hypothetical protein
MMFGFVLAEEANVASDVSTPKVRRSMFLFEVAKRKVDIGVDGCAMNCKIMNNASLIY